MKAQTLSSWSQLMPTDANTRLDLVDQQLKAINDRMEQVELLAVQMRERSSKDATLNMPSTIEVESRQFKTFQVSVYHPSHYKIELLTQILRQAADKLELPENAATVDSLLMWFKQSFDHLAEQGAWDLYYRALQVIVDPMADPDPANLSVPIEKVKCLPVAQVWTLFFVKITPFFGLIQKLVGMIQETTTPTDGQDSVSPSLGQATTTGA